ncbi:hypothetical protein BRARA_F01681 [Brassica rapa]|uniref:DUF4283 domain-containing protein n=1 Tax=Brassica campestris TaxID=3711 RepID=A0A397YY41_BRACM|nr:hypothetical protein BRARA_F01681 [Brassica rapa]
MADNLRRAIQDLTLGAEDEPVPLSATVCNEARRANQFSLMVRPIIPRKQNIRALTTALPRMWGLSGIISGRIVERRKLQFVFPSEELQQSVLNRGPWAFNDRMMVINRWVPGMTDDDLMRIPFWVQIRGIPLEYLTEGVIHNIGDRMGEVMTVDFNPDANAAVEFVRIRLNWNIALPLRFQKNFQFSPGVNTLLKFRYERLRGVCEICGMITHDTGECDQEDEEQQDGNEGNDPDEDNNAEALQVDVEQPVQQDPVVAADGNVIQNNSPQMDNVVLEENFWHNAPIDEVHEEFERRMGVVRTERKRKFVDNLMREMEVTSPDEDEDHATLEWEERRYSDVNVFQYGSFLDGGEGSSNSAGKRKSAPELVYSRRNDHSGGDGSKRLRTGVVTVDKHPVNEVDMCSDYGALSKIQRDYGDDMEQESVPPIDRGAVGPVPPVEP